MENMCDFNIEQSHLPKSQLQQRQKKGSFETLVFTLNIYLPVLKKTVTWQFFDKKISVYRGYWLNS